MATYYAQRASAGLLITEATAISPQGQGYADVPGLYGTEQLDGWKKVTSAVHAAGGKIVVQLWHVGRVSHTSLQPGNAARGALGHPRQDQDRAAQGRRAHLHRHLEPRALDAELPGIVQDYRHAARNAIATAGLMAWKSTRPTAT
jgi:N-ethylmaleimide reductase